MNQPKKREIPRDPYRLFIDERDNNEPPSQFEKELVVMLIALFIICILSIHH